MTTTTKGRNAPRSKSGCLTCRMRHVKCDEERPRCGGCRKNEFACDWPGPDHSDLLSKIRKNRGSGSHESHRTTAAATTTRQLRPLRLAQSHATSTSTISPPFCGAAPPSSNPDRIVEKDVPARQGPKGRRTTTPSLGTNRPLILPNVAPLPSLVLDSVPCSNSVQLSRQDRVLLDFFPASTVYNVHAASSSPEAWNPLRCICRATAASSSMVMHMVLAHAASEMRRRGVGENTAHGVSPTSIDAAGLYHYTTALRELRDCLGTRGAWSLDQGLDAVLTTIFFMIHYGMQSLASLDQTRMHVAGLTSLVATYLRGVRGIHASSPDETSFSPLSSLVLLWLLYADIMGHCFGSSQDLASLLVANGARPKPPVSLGQLFRNARLDFPALYGGGGVPAGLRLDDGRSVRCLEMAHRVLLIRFAIWKAKADPPTDDDEPGLRGHHPRYAFFMGELLGLQETYRDVIHPSSAHANNGPATTPPNQAAEMTSKLVAHFWACILFCRRWLGAPGSQPQAIHRQAVARIIQCLPPSSSSSCPPKQHKHQQDKGTLIRFAWPVFMAAIETTEDAQRDALMGSLAGARDASAECEWSWATAREIVVLQMRAREGKGKGQEKGGSADGLDDSDAGAGCWVDLARFMQVPSCATTATATAMMTMSVVVDAQ